MADGTGFTKGKLIAALAQIAGRPPATYSKDQLTHANNTIVEMQRIATEALCSSEADSAKDEPYRKLIAAALEWVASYAVYAKACDQEPGFHARDRDYSKPWHENPNRTKAWQEAINAQAARRDALEHAAYALRDAIAAETRAEAP